MDGDCATLFGGFSEVRQGVGLVLSGGGASEAHTNAALQSIINLKINKVK